MKFFIETYGCQMNVSDSELVSTIMTKNDFEYTAELDEADIIIFNSCSVRKHAEDRVLGRIANEMSRKTKNPNIQIGVIGCMAQRLGKELQRINEKIDFVVGVDQYKNIPHIISENINKKEFLANTIVNHDEIYKDIFPTHLGINNAFVTIMRGCNNFCTYCIVPYTRGRERSRAINDIIKEVKVVGENGFKDITLLGQNVNSYNYNSIRFPDLLKRINSIDTIERIRFVTSHPKDISNKLIEVMTNSKKVCEHIHLPMQSGDNEILKKMNRGYTIEHYYEIVEKLRTQIPEIAITTDIITGFPGETEKQFQKTYEMMKKIEFDYAFTFKYSPRVSTQAANFQNQVPEAERLQRLQELIKLQETITKKKYQQQIGKTKKIYVEKISKKSSEEVAGKSRDFKITVFKGSKDLIGKFVKVKITEASGWTLRGELV